MLLFSGSWCMRDFVCALQEWCVCFPYLSGSPIIKSHCPSRSDDQGIPSPFVRTAGWVPWCEVQNFHNRGRTSLVFLFSSYLLRGMGFEFIVIVPLLLSCCDFHFFFERGVSFLVCSSILLLIVVQQLVAVMCRRRWTDILLHRCLETEASEIQFGVVRWQENWRTLGLPQAGRSGTVWPLDRCRPNVYFQLCHKSCELENITKFIICKVSLLNPIL